MLSVYVCTFDAHQHVVFINKLFEFEYLHRGFKGIVFYFSLFRTINQFSSHFLNAN
jgi:hypothetical protein